MARMNAVATAPMKAKPQRHDRWQVGRLRRGTVVAMMMAVARGWEVDTAGARNEPSKSTLRDW